MDAATKTFRAGERLEGAEQALTAVHQFLAVVGTSAVDGPILGLLDEIADLEKGRLPQFLRPAATGGTPVVSATEAWRRMLAVAAVEMLHVAGDTLQAAYAHTGKVINESPRRIQKWRERLGEDGRSQIEDLVALHRDDPDGPNIRLIRRRAMGFAAAAARPAIAITQIDLSIWGGDKR